MRLPHIPVLVCLLFSANFVAQKARAELIDLDFSDATAVDGLIDGASELFQTSTVNFLGTTFTLDVLVESPLSGLVGDGASGLQHNGAGQKFVDASGEDFIFSVSVSNFVSNGTLQSDDIASGFRMLSFATANQTEDSGSIVSINGSPTLLTWNDLDGGSDFAGHVSGTGIDLRVTNGDAFVSSFRHNFVGGSWRYNAIQLEFVLASNPTAIPEPSSAILLLVGLSLPLYRRQRISA